MASGPSRAARRALPTSTPRPHRQLGRVVAFVVLLALATTPFAAAPATAAPATARRPSDLQALLDQVVAAGVPGVIARVHDAHGTWQATSGVANLATKAPLRAGMRYRAGSVTKTFVATVVLQLVGEHRLGLGDSVERWLPGLVPDGTAITVRELLNHTSGLFDYTEDPTLAQRIARGERFQPRQLVALATAHPPRFAPGTSWSYSNTGYIVLGLIIERVTGKSLGHQLRTRLLAPLHLDHTSFPTASGRIAGAHAHGYLPADNGVVPSPDGQPIDVTTLSPSWAWAAGAMISTASDLARFYHALLAGRLLRRRLLQAMETTVAVDGAPGFGYGLGLYRLRLPCGVVWGHDGGVPGYANVAYNSKDGTRAVNLVITMQPVPAAAQAAFRTASAAAVCRAFGQPPSMTAAPAVHAPALR